MFTAQDLSQISRVPVSSMIRSLSPSYIIKIDILVTLQMAFPQALHIHYHLILHHYFTYPPSFAAPSLLLRVVSF